MTATTSPEEAQAPPGRMTGAGRIAARDMSEAEADDFFDGESSPEPLPAAVADPSSSDAAPEWAPPLPPGLKVPTGTQLTWLRIRAAMTAAPHKGDRIVVCWPINEVEERQAVNRARGDQYLLLGELAKATIRVVDAVPADRTGQPGHPGNVSVLWRELGPKGRHLVRTYYTRTHQLTDEETQDFFLNCFATRIAEAG